MRPIYFITALFVLNHSTIMLWTHLYHQEEDFNQVKFQTTDLPPAEKLAKRICTILDKIIQHEALKDLERKRKKDEEERESCDHSLENRSSCRAWSLMAAKTKKRVEKNQLVSKLQRALETRRHSKRVQILTGYC